MHASSLAALGWTDALEAAFTTYAARGFEPARVVAEHRGGYLVRGERDERLAHPRGKLRDDELFGGMPAVGDWIAVCDAPGGRAAIEAVLPRRTRVSRKTPWLKSEEHVLVANVDTVFLVSGLDGDFNTRRLERYLAAAWDSGAEPVVVLTKLDLCRDLERLVEAEAVAIGVPIVAISNVTGEGMERLRAFLEPGRTVALLGSSGVGKSTLINRLAGRRLMPTAEARRDGRGRHTTRHRQLLVLPGGALLVDSPGLRELQVWEGDLDGAFADVAARRALPVQRLRARAGARLRRPESGRDGSVGGGAAAELPQARARAARGHGTAQLACSSRAEAPLEGAGARDAAGATPRRSASLTPGPQVARKRCEWTPSVSRS